MLLSPVVCIIAGLAPLIIAVPQPAGQRKGVAISLFKKSDFVNAGESVDLDSLGSHVASVHAKILLGFENYKKNRGLKRPSPIKAIEKRANYIPLDYYTRNPWYGAITLGDSIREYKVVFDTGSSDFFIPSEKCDESCTEHARWFASRSKTARNLGDECRIAYSDGSNVFGYLYSEIVSFPDGLSASDQTVCAAVSYPPAYMAPAFVADGLMGMAFPSISSYGTVPFIHSLFNQGKITSPIFSFELQGPEGELFIGGVNNGLFTGEIAYVPVTFPGFWLVQMDNILVNGVPVLSNIPAIIDTGSIVIAGPSVQVDTLHYFLGGTSAIEIENGVYTVPCARTTEIAFTFSGRSFPLAPASLDLGPVSTGSPVCISSFVGRDIVEGLNVWVIGNPFLEGVYSTFDFNPDNPQVGFATLS